MRCDAVRVFGVGCNFSVSRPAESVFAKTLFRFDCSFFIFDLYAFVWLGWPVLEWRTTFERQDRQTHSEWRQRNSLQLFLRLSSSSLSPPVTRMGCTVRAALCVQCIVHCRLCCVLCAELRVWIPFFFSLLPLCVGCHNLALAWTWPWPCSILACPHLIHFLSGFASFSPSCSFHPIQSSPSFQGICGIVRRLLALPRSGGK